MNRLPLALHVLYVAGLFSVWFGLYFWSDRIIDLNSGLIICGNDCTDFHNLSDYLLREGRFAPIGGDFHTTPFYWLYIAALSGLKALFGAHWEVAYAALMAAALYGTTLLALRYGFGMARDVRLHAACFLTLTAGNLTLLTYGRTLLTDYPFALMAVAFFLLVARAWAQERPRLLVAALAFALAMCFFRPNGVFLLCLGTGVAIIMGGAAWRRSVALSMVGVVGMGLAVWVISAGMSVYAARNLEAVEKGTVPLAGAMGQFLEFNYTGDDNLGHADRKGALLTNTPYKSWRMNDGSFKEIVVAFVARIPRTFEIWLPNYSSANNLYRLLFYGVLYIGAVGFLVLALRSSPAERGEPLMFAALVLAYLLIFVAVSHVTLRFRLVFDVALALAAAAFYSRLLQRVSIRTVRA